MKPSRLLVLTFLGLLARTQEAHANRVCVVVDPARDGLSTDEQAAARQVLENYVLAAGGTLGEPCDTWTASHVRLGGSVHVLLSTPRGNFTASASSIEALDGAYEALVRQANGLVALPELAPRPSTPSGQPAPAEPSASREAGGLRGVFYARVGYAIAPATDADLDTRLGPTLGAGYRRLADRWIFDVSVMNLHAWRRSSQFDSGYCLTFTSFGRLAAYRTFPRAGDAPYVGGGVSFGESEIKLTDPNGYVLTDNAYGVNLEGTVGWELLRQKAVRVFFEAWVQLPLARTETVYYTYDPATMVSTPVQGRYWAPTIGLATGLGF